MAAAAQALPLAGLQSCPRAGRGGPGMAAIKAKCKFPQPCVVLALGRVRGLVAGRGGREGQTSPSSMPGACQARSGPCAGRKGVGSSAPALVLAHLCPHNTWAAGQSILSHCHALTGKLPKEMSPSPQNQKYWGTFCTILGENITFQPQGPLAGAVVFSFLPSSHSSLFLRIQG